MIEIDNRCLTSAAIPSKDEPPLVVDADRVKSFQHHAVSRSGCSVARASPSFVASSSICNWRKKLARQIRWDVAGANVLPKECAQPIMIASVILYECCIAAETVLGMRKCSATSARGFA
jgi:hypothetical protein